MPLGFASPSPSLLPVTALSRALAATTRPGHGAALGYESTEEHAGLRRAIARRALSWGFAADPEEVIVTGGALEGVYLALRAVTRPGDVVAIECPAYYGTLQTLESLGLRVVEIPCHPGAGLDVDALERILARQRLAAVVAVPNYSNPTGSLMPEEAKRRLVRILGEREVPLVEDDVFGDFSFTGDRAPCVRAFDCDGLVLTCGSFSKTLAPGWRIGYILPGRFREQVSLLKFSLNVATSAGPQRAVARFLESGSHDCHLRTLAGRAAGLGRAAVAGVRAVVPTGTAGRRSFGAASSCGSSCLPPWTPSALPARPSMPASA